MDCLQNTKNLMFKKRKIIRFFPLLTGNNTYTGGTFIDAGTLTLGTSTAIPPNGPMFVVNNGILNVNNFLVNVSGNYFQGPNTAFKTFLVNQSNFGRLVLNGTATISPEGIIYVTVDPNGVKVSDFYDVITATAPPNIDPSSLRIIPLNGPYLFRASIFGTSLRLIVLLANNLSNQEVFVLTLISILK